MPSIFEKLSFKLQREIVVINAPSSFEPELETLKDVVVLRDAKKAKAVHFAIAFATKQAEVDALSQALAAKAEGDAPIWFAYPKGTSKKCHASPTATLAGTCCAAQTSTRCAQWR